MKDRDSEHGASLVASCELSRDDRLLEGDHKHLIENCICTLALSNRLAIVESMDEAALYFHEGMTLKGERVGESNVKAAWMFQRSADMGHAQAAFEFAQCLRSGLAGPKDLTKVRAYLFAAVSGGFRRAIYPLAQMVFMGRGGPINETCARELFELDAKAGSSAAMNQLGLLQIRGIGGDADVLAGMNWWWRGAVLGDHRCAKNLGMSFVNGDAPEQDDAAAKFWLRRAVALGSLPAMNMLRILQEQVVSKRAVNAWHGD